jgi:hypothetical protein
MQCVIKYVENWSGGAVVTGDYQASKSPESERERFCVQRRGRRYRRVPAPQNIGQR